jgi:sugar phosphate isomerase/epimerase
MRIGFFSACLANIPFADLLKWASETGFKVLEVEVYENSKHIDVVDFDADKAKRVKSLVSSTGMKIAALSYCENFLDPDAKQRMQYQTHLKKAIAAAGQLEVPKVLTFTGRDPNKSFDENLQLLESEWGPIVDFAKEQNVKLAIEPCPMGFYYPLNVSFTADAWDHMFKSFAPTMGLCLDPSHLVWQQIDYLQVVKNYGSNIIHAHAKDCEIDYENLRRGGILNSEWIDVLFTGKSGPGHRKIKWKEPRKQWWRYRIPGLGEVKWVKLLTELKLAGYDSDLVIEHEDPIFYGSEEANKQGLVMGLRYLNGLLPEPASA